MVAGEFEKGLLKTGDQQSVDSVIAVKGTLDSKQAQILFAALQSLRAKALSNELERATVAG